MIKYEKMIKLFEINSLEEFEFPADQAPDTIPSDVLPVVEITSELELEKEKSGGFMCHGGIYVSQIYCSGTSKEEETDKEAQGSVTGHD